MKKSFAIVLQFFYKKIFASLCRWIVLSESGSRTIYSEIGGFWLSFWGLFGLSHSSMSLFRQLLYTFGFLLSAEISDTRAVPNGPSFWVDTKRCGGDFSEVPTQSIWASTPIDGIWQCCFYRCCFLRWGRWRHSDADEFNPVSRSKFSGIVVFQPFSLPTNSADEILRMCIV